MSSSDDAGIRQHGGHWHFDLMLNASVMTARIKMKVYIFHSHQFHALVMSLFFHPHEPFDDVTLDDIHPCFHPLRYPTNGEFDFDTRLISTCSVESDPDTHVTPTYSMESDLSEPFEPSYPSVIRLTSYLSSSSVAPSHASPPIHGGGFIRTRAVLGL